MRINDYLTDDTSLISAYKKNGCIAVYPGREEIFYKAFDCLTIDSRMRNYLCTWVSFVKFFTSFLCSF